MTDDDTLLQAAHPPHAPDEAQRAWRRFLLAMEEWALHWAKLDVRPADLSHLRMTPMDGVRGEGLSSIHLVRSSVDWLMREADRASQASEQHCEDAKRRMREDIALRLDEWAAALRTSSDRVILDAAHALDGCRRWLQSVDADRKIGGPAADKFESALLSYCSEWDRGGSRDGGWRVCEMVHWPLVCGRTWEYGADDDPLAALHELADGLRAEGAAGVFGVQWRPDRDDTNDSGAWGKMRGPFLCLVKAFHLPGPTASSIRDAALALMDWEAIPTALPGSLLSSSRLSPRQEWAWRSTGPLAKVPEWTMGRAALVVQCADDTVRRVEDCYRNFALDAPDVVMRAVAAQAGLCAHDTENPLPAARPGLSRYGIQYGPSPSEHIIWMDDEARRYSPWRMRGLWHNLWRRQLDALGGTAWAAEDSGDDWMLHPEIHDMQPMDAPMGPKRLNWAVKRRADEKSKALAEADKREAEAPAPTPPAAGSRPKAKPKRKAKAKVKGEREPPAQGKSSSEPVDNGRKALEAEFIKASQGLQGDAKDQVRSRAVRLAALDMPQAAQDEVKSTLIRLAANKAGNSDHAGNVNFLRLVERMPWGRHAPPQTDLRKAGRILAKEHYGMKDVKSRILDLVAAQLRRPSGAKAMCLVGPPGVGKTTIAGAVAKAMNRPFERISLAGVSWDVELRGNSRLWSGARPGSIAKALRRAGAMNPVILLDEVDKVAQYRGSSDAPIADALLELLDPSQTQHFRDHYLDFPMDVSSIMFVASANSLERMSRPLLDRLEIVEVPGYLSHEKAKILTRHIIPAQAKAMKFSKWEFAFEDDALQHLVTRRSPESGVRMLEGAIMKLAERRARWLLEHPGRKPASIRIEHIERELGPAADDADWRRGGWPPGAALGLATGAAGGSVLRIEAAFMHDESKAGDVLTTGRMGDIMRESVLAARQGAAQWLRAQSGGEKAAQLCLRNGLHVHAPAGAVPKDGPSAGVAIAAALSSSALQTPVRQDVAMTGEVTLAGGVLAVGGVRDKVAAACWSGMDSIILPKANKMDFQRMPKRSVRGLSVLFVEHVSEALDYVMAPASRSVEADCGQPGRA